MTNSPNLFFRELTHADIPTIIEMCKNIWDGEDYVPSIIDRWLDDKESNNFGAYLDREMTHLVGTGRIKWLSNTLIWIEGGRVALEYQKRGVGFKISKYCIDFAQDHGAKIAQYDTWTENHGSCKLAEAHNFYQKDYHDAMFAKKEELIYLSPTNKFGPELILNAENAFKFLQYIDNGPKEEINMGWSYLPFKLHLLKKNEKKYSWKRNDHALIQIHRFESSSSTTEIPKFELWLVLYGSPEAARDLLISEMNLHKEDSSLESIEIFYPSVLRPSMQDLGFHWVEFPHPSGIVLFEKKLE